MKLEISDFEEEARAWCIIKGEDPDKLVQYPHPEGYAVMRRRPLWKEYAMRLHENWMASGLVSRALRRLGL